MPRTRPPYPPAFRRQMIELVRAGRSVEELAREWEAPKSVGQSGSARLSFNRSAPGLQLKMLVGTSQVVARDNHWNEKLG